MTQGNHENGWPRPPSLSAQRRTILEVLREKENEEYPLSQWYLGALYAAENQYNPDRLSQAAQSLRELLEKLPRVVQESPIQMVNYDFHEKQRTLSSRISKDRSRYPDGWRGQIIDDTLAKTLNEAEIYFKQRQQPSRKEQIQTAVTRIDPLADQFDRVTLDRKLRNVSSICKQLEGFAHHQVSSPEAFAELLENLDETLLDLLAPITARDQEEILSILQSANITAQEVELIFTLIERRGANHAFFFTRASDPSWLGILRQRGYFSHPPDAEHLGDGQVNLPNWWPMYYLSRMATLAPEEVIEIIQQLPEFDNPRIYETILNIALQLNGKQSVMLQQRLLQGPHSHSRPLPHGLPELLVHWTAEHQTKEALALAKRIVYFDPDPQEKEKRSQRREQPAAWTTVLHPLPRLEDWVYIQAMENGVKPLAKAAPYQVARILTSAVNSLICQGMHQDKVNTQGDQDRSDMHWPELRGSAGQRLQPNDALVFTMTFACEQVMEREPESIEALDNYLRGKRWRIFRRLRQHLYALHPDDQTKPWIREIILDHQDYAMRTHHYEFQQMIRSACETFGTDLLAQDELASVCDSILSGPNQETFRNSVGTQNYTDDLFTQHQRYFHRMQLRPFQKVLTGAIRDYFQTLEQESIRIISDDDYLAVGRPKAGFITRHSPKPVEELEEMGDEELLLYINDWEDEHRDPEDLLEEITIEALSEAFKDYFRDSVIPNGDRLRFWIENRDRIQRPIYVRGMINAMMSHIKTRDFSRLDQWLEICEWVLSHPDQEHEPSRQPDGVSRDNPHWGDCRRSVGDLVGELITTCLDNKLSPPQTAKERLLKLLGMLCTQFDWRLTEGTLAFPGRNNWMEEAINNTRSRALRDLIKFGTLLKANDPEVNVQPVLMVLESRLAPSTNYPLTLPEQSILGERYVELLLLDEVWTDTHKTDLFPKYDKQRWTAAFGALLEYQHPHQRIFESLKEDFEFGVKNPLFPIDQNPAHTALIETLGRHLFRYYIYGLFPLSGEESLIERYYQMTKDCREHWASLFKRIGLDLYHAEAQLGTDIENKFKAFFEWRLGQEDPRELRGIGLWLEAAYLDPEWRLDACSRILDVYQGDKPPPWIDWGKIAGMMPEHTEKVVQCFLKFTESIRNDTLLAWKEPAKQIIKAGLDSNEETVRLSAERARETWLTNGWFDLLTLES